MKKLVSGVLALITVLSLLSVAFAAPFALESVGITVEVPDGMTAVDQSVGDIHIVVLKVDENPALYYGYVLMYAEELVGKGLADLSEEEQALVVASISSSIVNPSYEIVDKDGTSILVIASGDTTLVNLVVLADGWTIDVLAGKGDGVELTEEEIALAAELLFSITFTDDVEE